MIKIEHLSKRYKKLQALDNVSVEFTKGQVVALVGPNGSGKTTLIKSILSMVKPDSGRILFENKPVIDQVEYRRHIGYMPQISQYPYNMRVHQVFDMLKDIRNEQTNIDVDLFNTFNIINIEQKTMQSLSGGTRQKVSAALAFLFHPDVFILDEPTAGLDPLATEILKDKIIKEKKKNKLILITSHVMSDLDELATHIVYLQEGCLQFFDTISFLKNHTGEDRLGRAIACLMKNGLNKSVEI
jgi:Cu-processing system ATP-binding protein